MVWSPVGDASDLHSTTERLGLLLLWLAVGFQAVFCWPEIALGPFAVHDGSFHQALALRLLDASSRGESLLDPWVSFSSLGSPVWRTYQPLVHWLSALAIGLSPGSAGTVMGALTWLLLCAHPLAFFGAARWFGIGRLGAGVAAVVCLAPTATGNLDVFGLGYASYVWRGSGLLTQLWATPLFVLAVAAAARALQGEGRLRAALLIAATALCHFIFGLAAAVSATALAVWVPGEPGRRLGRLVTVGLGVALLCGFVVVPALHDAPFVNHSVWEPPWKWTSHGGPTLVGMLLRGQLLDAGRAPVLSLLLAGSAVAAALRWDDPRSRALLGLVVLWLLLAFGRQTWGGLLPAALFDEGVHMHRFVAVFQACAVLLVALGVNGLRGLPRRAQLVAAFALVLALVPVLRDRASYLRENGSMGLRHRLALEAELPDFEAATQGMDAVLEARPGRAFAGLAARWGKRFVLGDAPVYHPLARRRTDTASHLWHSMSIPSDALMVIDDASPEHLARFGVRVVLGPAELAGDGLIPRARSGRFTLWEVPGGGYFSVERDPSVYPTGASAPERLVASRAWLAAPRTPAGEVLEEERDGAEHSALVSLPAAGTVVFRSSFHPGWRASVDGRPAPTRAVVPGFVAVDLPAGRHDLRLRYVAGWGKAALLWVGLLGFVGLAAADRRGLLERLDGAIADRSAARVQRLRAWATPSRRAWLGVVALSLLATAPFFRGELLLGHDAMEYPTRLAELDSVLRQGVLLPVWAPDLGAGFGQPMFAFVSPLLLFVAEALHLLGLGLAASLNGAVVALTLLGALAMAALGRRIGGLPGGLIAAAAFLFGGYLQLELYVRGALMEFSGLALLPVALLALLRCLEAPGARRIGVAAVALAAVALSHNAVLLMAAPALAWVVLLRAPGLRAGLRGVTAGVGGLGLSAWFWLPALAEKQFTHAHRLLERSTRWDLHFLYRGQLLDGGWGYGLSVLGPEDGMGFGLGWVLVLLVLLGVVEAARAGGALRATVAVALAVGLGGLAMAQWGARPLWAQLELLQYLQFPWRFLLLPAVFLPLVAAASARLWRGRWAQRGPAFSVAALALAGVLHLSASDTRALDDAEFAPARIAEKGLNTTTFEEFEPLWVDRRLPYRSERLSLVSGDAQVRVVSRAPHRQEFVVDAGAASVLELGTVWFPGWSVAVNGEDAALSWADSHGLPRFAVPAGRSEVVARFSATPVRRWARGISLLFLLSLAGSLLMGRRDERPSEEQREAQREGRQWLGASLLAGLAMAGVLLSSEPLPDASPDAPSAAELHVGLASRFKGEGRADLAERELRAALALEDRSDARIELGLLALEQGREEEAAQSFLRATELSPDSYAAWIDLGIARSRLGQDREALDPFARALELDPGSLDARHNLGMTWRRLGDPARAVQYLSAVVQRAPRRGASWVELGQAEQALGNREAAESAFSRARQLESGQGVAAPTPP